MATGHLTFHALRASDLGLLLAALGTDPDHPFPIKVGGGKPVGLGSVKIELNEATLLTERTLQPRLRLSGRLGRSQSEDGEDTASVRLSGEALAEWQRAQIRAATEDGVLLREAYSRLQTIYVDDVGRKPAPDQQY